MFRGEGHHIDSDEAEPREDIHASMRGPEGFYGYKDTNDVVDPNTEESDESGEDGDEDEETEELDMIFGPDPEVRGDGAFHFEAETDYSQHGVATGDEAEIANIPVSGEIAPRMPRGVESTKETNRIKNVIWSLGRKKRKASKPKEQ